MQPNSGISRPSCINGVGHQRTQRQQAEEEPGKSAQPQPKAQPAGRAIISSRSASITPKTKLARCGSGVYLSACSQGP
jgi:hypothetical protein